MRIFVTGAASFIGTELLNQCRDRGIDVVGVDSRTVAGCHAADIRDPAIADLIPEDVDAIVHLAALSRDPDCRNRGRHCFDVNVMGTLNLMEAAETRRARQFVFASSEWVYDSFQPGVDKTEDDVIDATRLTSEYAFSKFVSENNLRQKSAHGFCAATVLRFGIVYGSRSDNWSAVEALFNAVATRDEVGIGSLATGRRFLHVSDVADGILASLGRLPGFEIINIQGRRMVTLGDVIATSARLLGRSPRVTETAPAAPSLRPVSSVKAERLLGWQARVELEEGLIRLRDFLGIAP
ncbi:NAD(P)-dependent oxidoreductase [Magnetospirillum sp. SS-4]|uniref:NAD-dependent epimerase/dehydratase family protein n=1 Tax=Magnetospirillum sp. SS-4 TaxID=2681465 RepID=UPI0013846B81|nr:NAD(P)-dependent oxidoreductase [Magnetospirillum sp. SS-4]CAA7614516.1 putative UDP-glucuronate 4-epimerase [Magnetospirillum sp. SS-4]